MQIVTVALDTGGRDAVAPFVPDGFALPVLVDTAHETVEHLGFVNVPMAVWVDEEGRIARPAHAAQIERSPLRDLPDPEGDDRISRMLRQVKRIPDRGEDYPAEVADWVRHGAESRFAVPPEEVAAHSRPVGRDEAEAAACFELGQHRWDRGDRDGARRWWRRAHELDPSSWSYKRQAWSLETTGEGELTDLIQAPTEAYGTGWLEEVERIGADNYYAD